MGYISSLKEFNKGETNYKCICKKNFLIWQLFKEKIPKFEKMKILSWLAIVKEVGQELDN